MRLFEEIESIFKENQNRISIAMIMEVVEDISSEIIGIVAKSDEEYEALKKIVENKIKLKLENNLKTITNADKS